MRLSRLTVAMAALGALLLGACPAGAAPSAAPSEMIVYAVDGGDDPGELADRLVQAGLDLVSRDAETIFVLGDQSVGAQLAGLGVSVVDTEPAVTQDWDGSAGGGGQDALLPRRLDGNEYPTFYGGYRTVDGYLDFSDDLAEAYPFLVRSVDYGESWNGDVLRAVCITSDAYESCRLRPDVEKTRFLVVAQTHARELTTSEVMWRFMSDLVDGYGRSAQITGLLRSTEVWIVPQVNPDGIRVTEEGITEDGLGATSRAWQRKNVNDENSSSPCSGPWSSSHEGIDLNRNFDIDWGRTGTSRSPCALTYGGPEAASEPETTAQVDLMQDLFRDQRGRGMGAKAPRDATGAMLTLHSYSDLVLLPWGFTTEHAPNEAGLRSYAFRMSYFNRYAAGQSGEILYNSSGATEDWAYADLGIAGFTWEMGPQGGSCGGFFPPFTCQDEFYDTNRAALLYAAEAARRPYTSTLGPTVLDPRANPRDSGKVAVTATANDVAYGVEGVGRPESQGIAKARIFLGRPPWAGGEAERIRVKGGGGGSNRIKGFVDAPGTRTLAYLQARDGSGKWGPVRPIWIGDR